MKTMEAITLLKALADRSRMLIVSALADRPQYVEELSQQLNLVPSTVSFHLKKLEDAGLVRVERDQYYAVYHLCAELFDQPLRTLIIPDDRETEIHRERLQMYRDKVLKTFFRYGKLTKIPVQRKKRRIVLEKIAERFELGKRYPEKEVNLIIADYHDDFCTIRREMICEKIMMREKGVYWKLDQH
jgi:ArsR family transcriptional regulator, arsenate/arsenite/antimonite-responsive transcriptional repressor